MPRRRRRREVGRSQVVVTIEALVAFAIRVSTRIVGKQLFKIIQTRTRQAPLGGRLAECRAWVHSRGYNSEKSEALGAGWHAQRNEKLIAGLTKTKNATSHILAPLAFYTGSSRTLLACECALDLDRRLLSLFLHRRTTPKTNEA